MCFFPCTSLRLHQQDLYPPLSPPLYISSSAHFQILYPVQLLQVWQRRTMGSSPENLGTGIGVLSQWPGGNRSSPSKCMDESANVCGTRSLNHWWIFRMIRWQTQRLQQFSQQTRLAKHQIKQDETFFQQRDLNKGFHLLLSVTFFSLTIFHLMRRQLSVGPNNKALCFAT